jgi:hypothetical protein
MPKRTTPSSEMLAELDALFKKHNWSGHPIGILPRRTKAAPARRAALAGGCPPGTVLKTITFQLPDGTVVTKDVCV